MYDYFYGVPSDQFSFYRIPKVLYTAPYFKSLSRDAKTLYGMLFDRMTLSAKNGWFDEKGRVFIIFPITEIMKIMGCANQKATRLLRELEWGFGLIERKWRGQGKPALIYVKNWLSSEYDQKSHFLNHENHDSRDVKITCQEVWKSYSNNNDSNNTEYHGLKLYKT